MTRKDYTLIAAALNTTLEGAVYQGNSGTDSRPVRNARIDTIRQAAFDIATALRADNPNFDRDRFLVAVGVK